MDRYEVAQLNVGRAVAPLDDTVMADFMNWLDEINAVAERTPGFVWRLQGDNGNNTSLKVNDDPLFIVNLSVWSSIDALYEFTFLPPQRHAPTIKRHSWRSKREGTDVVRKGLHCDEPRRLHRAARRKY
jgi:hypothetical protein